MFRRLVTIIRREDGLSISRIPIIFEVEGVGKSKGELIRYLAPRTVSTIVKNFPLEGRCILLKDEVYFKIPLRIGEEKATISVEEGTIAYWPMGSAICIFLGKARPYSPVNRIGKITENIEVFRKVKLGIRIKVDRLSQV